MLAVLSVSFALEKVCHFNFVSVFGDKTKVKPWSNVA